MAQSQTPTPVFTQVEPCNWDRKSIWSFAENAAKALEYAPQKDIVSVTTDLGGKVAYRDFWSEATSGSIEILALNDFKVFLSTRTSPSRDRFTIAHEIGHYLLHYLVPSHNGKQLGPKFARRYPSKNDRAEYEANWFAGAFLMPEKKFEAALEKFDNDILLVAREFNVSAPAADVRRKTLAQR